MIKVKRGNVVLRIPDVDKQHYVDKGYSVLDSDGKVIEEAISKDVNTLQKALIDSKKEIEKLNHKIQELETENKDLKSKSTKKSKKAELVEE